MYVHSICTGYTLRSKLIHDLYTNDWRPEVYKHIANKTEVYKLLVPC